MADPVRGISPSVSGKPLSEAIPDVTAEECANLHTAFDQLDTNHDGGYVYAIRMQQHACELWHRMQRDAPNLSCCYRMMWADAVALA